MIAVQSMLFFYTAIATYLNDVETKALTELIKKPSFWIIQIVIWIAGV